MPSDLPKNSELDVEYIELLEERFRDIVAAYREEIKQLRKENQELRNLLSNQGSSTGSVTKLSREEVAATVMDIFGANNFDKDGKFIGSVGQSLAAMPAKNIETLYKLDDPNHGGLTPEELAKAKKILEDLKKPHVFTGQGERHPITGYGKWTVKIVNELLRASDLNLSVLNDDGSHKIDARRKPVFTSILIEGNEIENLDAPNEELYGKDPETGKPRSWMQFQGAFQIDEEIVEKEEKLDITRKGMYLLPKFDEKNNCDPDNPEFCQFVTTDRDVKLDGGKIVKAKEIPVHDSGSEAGAPIDKRGLGAYATGTGKTSKKVCCEVSGGKRNVILCCPTKALCASAYQLHGEGGFLQTWGCVIHQIPKKGGRPTKEPVFECHGKYPVTLNDLCYWKDENGQLHGEKGLSILEEPYLLAYIVRYLWNTERSYIIDNKGTIKFKGKTGRQIVEERLKSVKPDEFIMVEEEVDDTDQEPVNGVYPKKKILVEKITFFGRESYTRWIQEAVSKFIPEDTIVIFDECHFATAEWQTFEKENVFLSEQLGLGFKKYSATIKGIPFSSTSSFPRANFYMSSLQEKFIWQGKEYNLNDILENDKFAIFLPNMEKGLNKAQKAIVKKYDLSCVPLTSPFDPICEKVSRKMPVSTGFLMDGSKEMGFSFDIGFVIVTNILQNSNLQPNWEFSTAINSRLSLPSFMQQFGRVGRERTAKGKDGKPLDCAVAVTLSKDLEEFKIKPDVSVHIIRGALGGYQDSIERLQGIDDVFHLRASIALANEENGKAGLYPAELIVGATDGNAGLPKWGKNRPTLRVNPNLLAKHMGTYVEPRLEDSTAEETMDAMITTCIKESKPADDKLGENNFPYLLNSRMENPMIGEYGLKTATVKQILNGVIVDRLEQIRKQRKNKNPNIYKAEEKPLFDEVKSLHKLALEVKVDKNIIVGKEKNKEGKDIWVMKTNYEPEESLISNIEVI